MRKIYYVRLFHTLHKLPNCSIQIQNFPILEFSYETVYSTKIMKEKQKVVVFNGSILVANCYKLNCDRAKTIRLYMVIFPFIFFAMNNDNFPIKKIMIIFILFSLFFFLFLYHMSSPFTENYLL